MSNELRPENEKIIRITREGKLMSYVQHALYKISVDGITYLAGTGSVTKKVVDVVEILKKYNKNLRLVYGGIGTIEISIQPGKKKRISKLVLGLSDHDYKPLFEFIE